MLSRHICSQIEGWGLGGDIYASVAREMEEEKVDVRMEKRRA